MIEQVKAPPIVCSCGSLRIYPTTIIPKDGKEIMVYRCIKCKKEYHVGG